MLRFVCWSLVVTAGATSAHEMKVLVSRHTLPEGGRTTVYLSWGHRLPVDDLVDAAPIERYDLVSPGGTVTALKKDGVSLQANAVEVKESGVHTAVVARKPAVITYVFDPDGERQFKRGPKSAHAGARIDSASRSSQTGKALVAVGVPGATPPKAVGLAAEIVPLDGPAKWTANADVRFQLLIDGKPLTGADVFARPIGFKPDDAWSYATQSGPKGEFTVRPDRAGTWVLKAAAKRLTHGKTRDEYDYESFVTTLSLDVRQ